MNAQVCIQNVNILQEVVTIIVREYSYISEYIHFNQNSTGYYRINLKFVNILPITSVIWRSEEEED